MPINTPEKRRSASQILSGLFGPAVTPNSDKDAEWRQQVGWGYSGFLTASDIISCVVLTIDPAWSVAITAAPAWNVIATANNPWGLAVTTGICGVH